MLRIFLFKPVITIIEREETHENTMLDIIDQQQKSLEIQEKERQRHWYTCQEYFASHQPHLVKESPFFNQDVTLPIAKTMDVSSDDIAHIVADIRTVVEEKIKHVH